MRRERRDPALEQTDENAATDPVKVRLARARKSFKSIQDGDKKQREREQEDLRFYAGDQWPADVVASRAGQNASNGLPPVPARPCLVINKAREPVRQVLNQERQSDLGVTIVPADDFGGLSEPVDDSEVELREGLVRRVQRTSDAAAARTWAFERATIAGRGYYGVMTRYGDGKTRDQEVYVRRFYNQSAVSLGPHEQPDGSDAEEAFVGSFLPWETFKADHPFLQDGSPNPLVSRLDDSEDFIAEGEEFPDWYKVDGDMRMIHVAEHWYTVKVSRKLLFLNDDRDVWEDEATEAEKKDAFDQRTVIERQVKFEKIAGGTQILEETDWPGHYIPIIKVLGEELQPYDSERRCEGMVRPGRDAGIGSNYMISKLVEMVGLTPLQPLILDPESIEGWEAWYNNANTRTLPYLPQRSRGDDGREFREAHRPQVDPNLQPIAMSIQMFSEFIQSTMGVHDPSLGKVDPRLKSGKAIESVVAQDAHGTSNYIDNLARSIHYEGMIINDLLYPIYGQRPGRIAKMVNPQGEASPVVLGKPFVMEGGKPKIVTEGTEGARMLTLTPDAKFNIAVKVTKNFDLKREQTASFLGELVGANPAFMAQYGDMFFKSIDVPDHQEMAERAKIMLDPRILKMMDAKKNGVDIPPAIMQQLAQKDQQLKELTDIAHAQQRKLDTEQVKGEIELKKTAMQADKDIQLKTMELSAKAEEAAKDRAAKIEEARIAAAKQSADLEAEAREERMALNLTQQHEVGLEAASAAHEADQGEREHQQAMELAEQQAALAPEPAAAAE